MVIANLSLILLAIIIILVLIIFIILFNQKSKSSLNYQQNRKSSYKKRDWQEEMDEIFWKIMSKGRSVKPRRFMTDSEIALFNKRLIPKFGQEYAIFSQVSLGALVDSNLMFGSDEGKQLFSMINRYRVDFVLYSRKEKTVTAVIELDDPSHYQESRRRRDQQVNEIFKQAGIHLIRINSLDDEMILPKTKN